MVCFFELLAIFGVIYAAIQIIRLILADGDLTLMFYTKFGKTIDDFSGKVIWITGASTGIGRSLALELAKVPCKLILTSRREQELQQVKQQCLALGKITDDDILVLPLDLLDTTINYNQQVKNVLERFHKIDILVNNAGRSQRAKFENVEINVDKELFQLNVFSAVDLTTAVLPHFMERKQGHVAVVSSIAGKTSVPGSRSYTGSKHALHGYFECLRTEMAPYNIGVTMICPGPVFSDVLKNAFTEKQGEMVGQDFKPTDKRMTSERCAYLMSVGIANTLDEVWISPQPILSGFYFAQYTPSVMRWFLVKVGSKKLMKMRDGRNIMNMDAK
ncbi:hypothetical protein CHUAL_009350 [Chamberlinius hualienensis]